MKKQTRNPAQISMTDERIVDSFSGGGGASSGIELATGRVVDVAINHDPDAILMHSINHPFTKHLQASVWDVEPEDAVDGAPVGLLWASPDCKHFSKAKGAPLVDRNIRGLSWIVVRWCLRAPPRVFIMENVEEIQTWGPLIPMTDQKTGRPMKKVGKKLVVSKPGEEVPKDQLAMVPDPARKGETFKGFVAILTDGISQYHPAFLECCEFLHIATDSEEAQRMIHGLGYDVDHWELVAADYGAPTSRKRFVMVGRRDGKPIRKPERTHAPADHPDVIAGKLLPWRSAAEIIDWNLPCPSIFATKEQIKEQYGLEAVRPLAENTQRRVIRGVDKHTIQAAKPFIVPVGYGERRGQAPRVHDVDKPLPTVVGTGKQYLGEPKLTPFTVTNTTNSVGAQAGQPVHTVTSAGNQMLVEPVLTAFGVECNHSGGGHVSELRDPIMTITAKHTGGVCEPVLSAFNLASIGQTGGGDRIRSILEPAPTTVSKQEACLISANLSQYHTERGSEYARANRVDAALPTVDASNRYAVTTAHLTEYYGTGVAAKLEDPLHTVVSHDRQALTTAFMQPFHAGGYHGKGNSPEKPVNTVTSSGGQSLVTAQVAEFKGQDLGQPVDKPLRTITASWGQFADVRVQVVRYDQERTGNARPYGYWPEIRQLLNQYCGYTLAEDEILLLYIEGVWYYISDIGLRMLTPRELYNAMGFPPDYVIDFINPATGKPYSKAAKVARCGNAVCPPMAEAVVRANLPEWCDGKIETMEQFRRVVAV